MMMIGWIDGLLILTFVIFVVFLIRHAIMNRRNDSNMMYYYMFTVESVNCIVYVSTKNQLKAEDMDSKRIEVGKRFNLSDEDSLNIGISYLGWFSEKEMAKGGE